MIYHMTAMFFLGMATAMATVDWLIVPTNQAATQFLFVGLILLIVAIANTSSQDQEEIMRI